MYTHFLIQSKGIFFDVIVDVLSLDILKDKDQVPHQNTLWQLDWRDKYKIFTADKINVYIT